MTEGVFIIKKFEPNPIDKNMDDLIDHFKSSNVTNDKIISK